MNTSPITQADGARAGFPWMTLTLCCVCLVIGILFAFLDTQRQVVIIEVIGANPAHIAGLLAGTRQEGWLALAGSLLFHSSWLHLAGNLAYLWVFGMPVERRTGPLSLAVVFFGGGILAHLILALRLPDVDLPVIGASGAVSAVVGACAGLYPARRIGLYLPLGLIVEFVRLPTLLVVGSWFVLQLLYSLFGPISGAMAWWTHLAGFALGLSYALLARALIAARSGSKEVHGRSGS